jgi:hypothetical protein
MVTEGEAVEMYARYFAARHKITAARLARKTAQSLKVKGDVSGHKIWNEVADTIDRHQQENRRTSRSPSHYAAGKRIDSLVTLFAARRLRRLSLYPNVRTPARKIPPSQAAKRAWRPSHCSARRWREMDRRDKELLAKQMRVAVPQRQGGLIGLAIAMVFFVGIAFGGILLAQQVRDASKNLAADAIVTGSIKAPART